MSTFCPGKACPVRHSNSNGGIPVFPRPQPPPDPSRSGSRREVRPCIPNGPCETARMDSFLEWLHLQAKHKWIVGYCRLRDYPPDCPHSVSTDDTVPVEVSPGLLSTQVHRAAGPCNEIPQTPPPFTGPEVLHGGSLPSCLCEGLRIPQLWAAQVEHRSGPDGAQKWVSS